MYNSILVFSQCTINVNGDLGEPQPLLIIPGTTEFFNPQGSDGIIRLNNNQQLELYCSTGFASPGASSNSIIITCTSGNLFLYSGSAFSFNTFTCSVYPIHKARKTGGRCFNNGYEVEIGFEVGSASRFLQVMTLCHDEITEETYYVKHKFTPASAAYQVGTRDNKIPLLHKKCEIISKVFHDLIGLMGMDSLGENMSTIFTHETFRGRPLPVF